MKCKDKIIKRIIIKYFQRVLQDGYLFMLFRKVQTHTGIDKAFLNKRIPQILKLCLKFVTKTSDFYCFYFDGQLI